ncbi:hypothetical protein [Piscirickettsia litoralis]|uniref:Uncharacterized protein n=1 Tax=Piscirickettsia litoralis TaxID=1891921 RepID=A0ABX2ZX55_9GAMM|nr:hypothetical protein [Piscirickettsia litoralis]ODN41132.1 hypothetical protein BGC07_17820 [Piscirickettsia litoralis]
MSAAEIKSIEGLSNRCKQIVKAIDKFLSGYELATNKKLRQLAINIEDHHDLTRALGLERCTEISRHGVVLYGVN